MRKIKEDMYYLDKEDVYDFLKNRPPLLMIDNVYVEPGVRAYTSKLLKDDEWYFECHFPGNPMMPGILQLESLFNTAAMSIKLLSGYKEKMTNVARIHSVKYKKHIVPGDQINIYTEIIKFKRGIATVKGNIGVDGEVCCEAEFVLVVLDDLIRI